MPARPYLQLRVQEIEALVAGHVRDAIVLKTILEELKHRESKRAHDLRLKVERLLGEIEPRRAPMDGRGGQRDFFEWTFNPSSEPSVAAGRTEQVAATDTSPSAGVDDPELQEGASVSATVSRIRSPEAAKRTPPKWAPPPTETLQPTWQPDDPPPLRFTRALRLLVSDIKKRGAGSQTISLEDGQRVCLDGAEHAYRFRWQGDEELFEGAAVEVIVSGRTVPGRIISLSPVEIVVDAEADLGATIRACVLRIDNTAMLVALADRMASLAVAQGVDAASVGPPSARAPREAGPFNADMAKGALCNADPADAPRVAVPPGLLKELNDAQGRAVQSALSSPLSYIWGPPGTGKTKTLAAVIQALFSAEKRTLVCSNTNQAVDQVLAKLCEVLTTADDPDEPGKKQRIPPEHVEALREGWIVRVGALAPEGPFPDWHDYVSLPGVTARKTQQLQRQIAELEERAARIEQWVLPARATLQAYQDLDRAIAGEAAAARAAQDAASNAEVRRQALEEAQRRIITLRTELASWNAAGMIRRAFMRGRDSIDADLRAVETALPAAREALTRAETAAASAAAALGEALKARDIAAAATAGKPREEARRAVDDAESQLGPIRTTLAELGRQVEEIAKTVLAQARVVGATATKLFLSPQTFGPFSAVIIDEASMLIPPALYNAAGLATERVIVSGDFRQLSPIVQTNERCLREELGRDVFSLAGIDGSPTGLKRATVLEEQYRMAAPICRLLSEPMYNGRLRTAATRRAPERLAPPPFAGTLTVVDTSTLGPVTAKDARGSWVNLMSALTVRNVCRHLSEAGFASDKTAVGAIVPYAGQRKLIERMLHDAKLTMVTVGTVHRYQGDEKQIIILDLVDGIGRPTAGLWHQADQPSDEGAKLFNVAISRAREHLVVVGDLAWLDKKLPASALLRQWLYRIQTLGDVVDARSILAMWPMAEDLRRYGSALAVDLDAARTGIFDEKDFLAVVQLDIARARQGIAIWSAFVTPAGVSRIADLLRARAQSGVMVRCVVRPPEQNGSMGEAAWAEGIAVLEAIGVTIDIRASMHEKVVLIDDETAWLGSLNLLSHTGHTREVMLRVDGAQTALGVAAFMAADPKVTAERAAGTAYRQENPACEQCGRRTRFVTARNGSRFWSCQPCGWTRDARTGRESRRGSRDSDEVGPSCPLCGKPMRKRQGKRGVFWGCTGYPQCTGTADNPDLTK